jgi:dienelactone hydrolase
MAPVPDSPESLAREFGERFVDEEFDAATDLLTEDGREAVVESMPEEIRAPHVDDPETVFQRYTYGLYTQYGDCVGVADVAVADDEATVTLDLELGTQDAVLSLAEDRIANVEFPTEYSVPDYVDELAFDEREVTVDADDVDLEGHLTVPAAGDAPYPGVLLVHGAGLHDPDGTAGASKILRDFAWGLASEGIATLRYEKRPNVEEIPDEELTIDRLVVDDAVAAAATLADAADVDADSLFVAGHSQGGMCAPFIAERHGDVTGIINLDGAADPGLSEHHVDLAKYQFEPDGDLTEEQEAMLEEQQAELRRVLEGDYEDDEEVMGKPGAWFREMDDLDTLSAAERLDAPVFSLKCGRADPDLQPEIAEAKREGYEEWDEMEQGPQDKVEFYRDLGHYFQNGPVPASMEGLHFGGNVAGYVLADVAEWVHEVADA